MGDSEKARREVRVKSFKRTSGSRICTSGPRWRRPKCETNSKQASRRRSILWPNQKPRVRMRNREDERSWKDVRQAFSQAWKNLEDAFDRANRERV